MMTAAWSCNIAVTTRK